MEKVKVQSSWLTHVGLGWLDGIRYLGLFQDQEVTICFHPESEKIFENVNDLEAIWSEFLEIEKTYFFHDDEIKSIIEITMSNLLTNRSANRARREIRKMVAKRGTVISEIELIIDKRVFSGDSESNIKTEEKLIDLILFSNDNSNIRELALNLICGERKPSKLQSQLIDSLLDYKENNKEPVNHLKSYNTKSIRGLLRNQEFISNNFGEEYNDLLNKVLSISNKIKLIIEDSPLVDLPKNHSKFGLVGTYLNMLGLTGKAGYGAITITDSDFNKKYFVEDLVAHMMGIKVPGRLVSFIAETGEAVFATPSGGHYSVQTDF